VQTPVPSIAGPTTQLETIGAVKMAPQPKEEVKASPKATRVGVKVHVVKRSTTSLRSQQERAAYRVAFLNKIEYVCIKAIVDVKIARDQDNGSISDKGSVVTYFNAVPKEELAQHCIQNELVIADDVKEFEGKV
jgi:hypothetical protein